MPAPDYLPLSGISGQGSNGLHSVEIPGGRTIDEIVIEYNYSATAGDEFDPSHFTAIRLNLNTEDIVDVKGTDLVTVESHKRGSNADGYLVINLADVGAKTFDGMNLTGLVTFASDAISLEIETTGARATSNDVTLKAFARYSPARKVRTVVPKMRRYIYNSPGAGEFEIVNMPRGPRYKGMHFLSSLVDGLKLYVNEVKKFDQSKARNDMMLTRYGLTPQTGVFHYSPAADGYQMAHTLSTKGARSMELKVKTTGAGAVPVLVEFFDVLDQPPASA